jgi:hypothetical protein
MNKSKLTIKLEKEQDKLNIRARTSPKVHIKAGQGWTLCGIKLIDYLHRFPVKQLGLKRCRVCTKIYLNRIGWNLR